MPRPDRKKQDDSSRGSWKRPFLLMFATLLLLGYLVMTRPMFGYVIAAGLSIGAASLLIKGEWRRSVFALVGIKQGFKQFIVLAFTIFCMLVSFSSTSTEEADELWRDGKKAKAVEMYSKIIERTSTPDPEMTVRVVRYHFERQELQKATHFCNLAIKAGVLLPLDQSNTLSRFYAEAKDRFAEQQAQEARDRKAAEMEKKKRDEELKARELAQEKEANEAELRMARERPAEFIKKRLQSRMPQVSVDVNNYAGNRRQKIALVRWQIGENLNESLTKGGAKRDIAEILQAVAATGLTYREVTVFGSHPLVDKLGNTTAEVVVKASYTGNTIDAINWDNFLPLENMYEVGNNVWLHPAFRE